MTDSATGYFVYDGDSNRVKAILNGVTTVYVSNYYEWTTSGLQKHDWLGYGPGATVTQFFYWTEPLKLLQTEWEP